MLYSSHDCGSFGISAAEVGNGARVDSKSVPVALAEAVSMEWCRQNRPLSVLESASA